VQRLLCLKVTVLVCLLFVAFLPVELVAFNAHAYGSSINTGFEPWYHYIGEMVNSASGNLFLSAQDISIRGRGFNIKIVRSYNSFSSAIDGPLGYGWTFNYNMHLVENLDGTVTLFDGDGSAHTFSSIEPGRYTPPPGVHLKLTKNPDGTFILRFKDGVYWNFDVQGKPVSIVDRNGNQLTLAYDGEKLLTVADDSGLVLAFDYDVANRIVRISDPMGRQITYEYAPAGNLVKVTDAMGYSTMYFYSDNLLEAVVNRFGGMLSFEYSGDNKVVEIEAALYNYTSGLPQGSFRLYSMDYGDQSVIVTNARGFKTTVEMNAEGNPTNFLDALVGVTSMEWDSDMNMVSFTDAMGHAWNCIYDVHGNLLNGIDPTGNSTSVVWEVIDTETRYQSLILNSTNGLGFTISFDYDASGNVIQITNAVKNSCYFLHDAYGNVVEFVDFRGYTTLYSYDTHGFMTSRTDALGNVTLYGYDAVGRLIGITDANGYTTTFVHDNNDRLIKIIDPTGNETRYFYNPEGSLESIIDPNGNQMNYTNNIVNRVDTMEYETGFGTSYVYDRRGNLIKTIDANGAQTLYSYDALDRLVSETDAHGNTETYTYDAVGNMLSKTDKNGDTMLFEYDSLGRKTKAVDALGNEVRCEYDALGQRIALQDASGHVTKYEYDPLNRLTKITDASGNETLLGFDANGNLINFTDANGYSTLYEYDPLNGLVKFETPGGTQTRLKHDAVGNIVEMIKPDGAVINYEYDPLNRLVAIFYPDGINATAKYDAGGRVIEMANHGIGLNDITQYEYNERNLVTSVDYDLRGGGGGRFVIDYEYDAVGNRIMMVDPQGLVATYDYNALGQLTSMQDPLGDVTTFEYDKVGRKTRVNYPNGMVSVYTYDATGNLLSLVNQNSSGDVIYSSKYSYDPVGNRISDERESGYVTSYDYDELNRLVKVVYPDGLSVRYVYDAVGNRLLEIVNDTSARLYAYDVNHQLLNAGGVNYFYDPNGNLIAKEEEGDLTSYIYDFEDRLTGVIFPSGLGVEYTYSANGARLSKTDSEGTVFYAYDFEDVLMEFNEFSAMQARYTHGPGMDEMLSMQRDGDKYYYHFDGLGSVVALTDASQNVVAAYEYDAFGMITEAMEGIENPYRFTGREYEGRDSGLYYYRARYYDPEVGRFTTVDPIRGCVLLPQTYNPYVYVINNPVNFVDPTGRLIFWIVAGAVLIGGGMYYAGKKALESMKKGEEANKKKADAVDEVEKNGDVGKAEEDYRAAAKEEAEAIAGAADAGADAYGHVANPAPTSKVDVVIGYVSAGASWLYNKIFCWRATLGFSESEPRIRDVEKLVKKLSEPYIDKRFLQATKTIPVVPANRALINNRFASLTLSVFTIEDRYTLRVEALDTKLLESHGGPSISSVRITYRADFDGDGDVDYDDTVYFVDAYIKYWSGSGKDPLCDFDSDCDIDYDDILAFVTEYIDYWTP